MLPHKQKSFKTKAIKQAVIMKCIFFIFLFQVLIYAVRVSQRPGCGPGLIQSEGKNPILTASGSKISYFYWVGGKYWIPGAPVLIECSESVPVSLAVVPVRTLVGPCGFWQIQPSELQHA